MAQARAWKNDDFSYDIGLQASEESPVKQSHAEQVCELKNLSSQDYKKLKVLLKIVPDDNLIAEVFIVVLIVFGGLGCVLGKFDEAIFCCTRHLDTSRELKDKVYILFTGGMGYSGKNCTPPCWGGHFWKVNPPGFLPKL